MPSYAEIVEYAWSGVTEDTGEASPKTRSALDLVFGDPPYNIGVKYADDPTNDKMEKWHYTNMIHGAVAWAQKNSRPGAMLWWVCPAESLNFIESIMNVEYGPQVYRIVWHETFSQYNRHDLTADYRFLLCHRKRGGELTKNLDAIREPSARMLSGDKRAAGPRIPGQVWRLRRLQGTALARVDWHPAQLPPEVLERIVRGWSNPGDLVVDLFAGSGSLGVVCQQEDRNFLGVERSPTYVKELRARLSSV